MSSAKQAYLAHRKEIENQMIKLQDALYEMDEVQRDNPKDWGYVGNVTEIESMLAEIIKFAD